MKKDLHNIDKLFKAALDNQTETPPQSAWDAIDKRLDKNKVVDINKKYIQLKRIAVALLILLLGFGAYTLNHWTKIDNPSQADSTIHNKTNTTQTINSIPTSVDEKNRSAAETATATVIKPNAKDLGVPSDKTNSPFNNDSTLTPADGNKKVVTAGVARALNNNVTEKKYTPGLTKENKSTNVKGVTTQGNTLTARQMFINKRKAKATLTNGGVDEVADESIVAASNERLATTNEKKVERLAVNDEQLSDPQLARLYSANPELISAPQLNSDIHIGSKSKWLPAGLGLTQQPGKRHTIKSGGALSATVFFSPNVSSNLLKDELHERMPGGMPPPRDHDDRDKIRDGEQCQTSYSVGILLDYNLNKHWSIQTGSLLTSRTIEISPKTIYADKDDQGEIKYRFNCSSGYTYLSSKTAANPAIGDSLQAFGATNTLKYISVPLALKYHYYVNKLDLFAFAGTTFNVLTKGKIATEIGNAASKEVTTTTAINGLKPNYFSGNIGLGLSYTITGSIALSFMPSYNFALNSSTRDATVKTYPNNFSLAAGIRYKL